MNCVSDRLRQAALEAKITDSRFPLLTSDLVLAEWGKIIQHDQVQRLEVVCMNAESHLDTAAAPSQDMLAQILATVNKMSNQQDSLIAENAGLKSQIISMHGQVNVLKDELYQARQHADGRFNDIEHKHKKLRSTLKEALQSPEQVISSVLPSPIASTEVATSLFMTMDDIITDEAFVAGTEEASADEKRTQHVPRCESQGSSVTQPLPLKWN